MSDHVFIVLIFILFLFTRTTAPKEPQEGSRSLSVVPSQADEVTAEHCTNTKVGPTVL